jgi:hypothetical protein
VSKDNKVKPTESGYYFHTNGHGNEEIIYLEYSFGSFWIHKIGQGDGYSIDEDKGFFGERISLPSEDV